VADVLYRCVSCNQILCDADFRIAPTCPICRGNEYRRATLIADDEMKAAIQRGFRYDESAFTYIDDALLKRGIFPVLTDTSPGGGSAN